MGKPTKLQKETLEIIREELKFMKNCENINSKMIYINIDKDINNIIDGTLEPQLTPNKANKLSDILYEIVTYIRDLER